MLKRENWSDAAPEVPVGFHEKFEETLANIENKKVHYRRMGFKAVLLVAAIGVLGVGTVVMAGVLFNWDKRVLDKFQPTQEQQEQLPEAGIVQDVKTSQVSDGVEVTLSQVLLDSHNLYMELKVTAEDGATFNGDYLFEKSTVLLDGKDIGEIFMKQEDGGYGGSGGFQEPDTTSNTSYYEIDYLFDKEMDWTGKTIGLQLNKLACYTNKLEMAGYVSEGTWSFEHLVEKNDQIIKNIDVNQSYDFGGYEVPIKSIEISPMGYALTADCDKTMLIEEDERNRMEYNGDDPGMGIWERMSISAIEFNDGTTLTAENDFTGGGSSGPDKDANEFSIVESFGRIIDVEQIKTIYLMKGDVQIAVE